MATSETSAKLKSHQASPSLSRKKNKTEKPSPLSPLLKPTSNAARADVHAAAIRTATRNKNTALPRTPVQPKVRVGAANDEFEREADTVADVVMRMPSPPDAIDESPVQIQRACPQCQHSTEGETPTSLESTLPLRRVGGEGCAFEASMKPGELVQGGSPLAPTVERFFSSRFNTGFRDVRVHSGKESEAQCKSIDAHAFTYKNHIWLGRGQQAQRTHIMAHELAHVVQQRPLNMRKAINPIGSKQDNSATLRPARYWVAGGRSHHMNGNAIQQAIDLGRPNGAEEEVWIPNGGRATAESGLAQLGVRGRADYYKADKKNARIGVYFKQPVKESIKCPSGDNLATPANLPNGRTSGPRIIAHQLRNADRAPRNIQLGEMKPADPDQVSFGQRQLAAYEAGIKFAVAQSNCWWKNHSNAARPPSWSLARNSPRRLTGMSIPGKYRFNPASPGSSRDLSIGEWYGNESVRIVFDPRSVGMSPIKGDLYAKEVGRGVYVHFARPANPKAIFDSLGAGRRGAQRQAWVAEATWTQNHVIAPLLKGPESVARKWRSQGSSAGVIKQNPPSASVATVNRSSPQFKARSTPVLLQTKKRSTRLRDSFDASRQLRWQNDWASFSRRFMGGTFIKEANKLKFLDFLYDAEKTVNAAGIPPVANSKRLPPRKNLRFQFGTNPEDPKSPRRHGRLDRLYGLLNVLSKPPVRRLGALRRRFGSLFVSVGNRLNQIKQRFKGRIKKQGRSARRRGGGWAGIAIKAFWSTALAMGGIVMRQTFNLLMDSLAAGLKKKLLAFLPFDNVKALQQQVEAGFPLLKELQAKFKKIESGMRAKVEELSAWFDGIMQPLRRGTEIARSLGTFIKWALVALQCGTPPGLGCLKLIAQEGLRMAIDWIMSTCIVRKRMVQVVNATGFFTGFPARVSRNIANFVEGLLPPGVAPVFDRSILKTSLKAEGLDCDRKEVSAISQGLQDLETDIGSEMFALVLEAAERYGVPSNREITVDDLQNIQNTLSESAISEEVLREYIRATPRPTKGKIVNFKDFIDSVKIRVRQRRASRQRKRFDSAWYKRKIRELAHAKANWAIEPLRHDEIRKGVAFAKPLIYRPDKGEPALGVSDVLINISTLDCKNKTLQISFVNIDLADAKARAVDSGLQGKSLKMTLQGDISALCPSSGKADKQ